MQVVTVCSLLTKIKAKITMHARIRSQNIESGPVTQSNYFKEAVSAL